MVTTHALVLDQPPFSLTEARTRFPRGLDQVTVSPSASKDISGSPWRPLRRNLVGEEQSNQTAITTFPDNDPAFKIMIEAIEKIAEYAALPDNWDSYGGVGLSLQARRSAQVFVFHLLEEDLLYVGGEIDILPVPTGGIQFEWAGQGGEIEIEIDQQGNLYSLIAYEDGHFEASPRDQPVQWSVLRDHIKRIIS